MNARDPNADDTINWPLYPKPTRAEIAASNDDAQAFLAYNARVRAATDALMNRLARGAVALIGGSALGLYAINVLWVGA